MYREYISVDVAARLLADTLARGSGREAAVRG